MIRDRRGVRRRFIYGQPRESKAASMPIRQADPRHPLLEPGQCRVEGGAIVVRAFTSTEQLEGFCFDPRQDPLYQFSRFLAWLSVEMACRYREGMAAAVKLGMTR